MHRSDGLSQRCQGVWTMYCSKCGKEIPDNSVFCWSCGNKIVIPETAKTLDSSASTDGMENTSLAQKYIIKFGVSPILVQPGDQAVDNQIKTIAGNKVKSREYDKLVIVSLDQGYREKMKKWKEKYDIDPHDFILCKNIESALNQTILK